MIDLDETNVGDCVYTLMSIQTAPVFAEVVRVLKDEGGIEVQTQMWGRRVVLAQNAFWEEKDAKRGKLFKTEHNYRQWAQEYFNDEETETDNRINTIHNGQSEECEDSRETLGNVSIQESPKRKQKVIRKSAETKRKTKRNRKVSSKKK